MRDRQRRRADGLHLPVCVDESVELHSELGGARGVEPAAIGGASDVGFDHDGELNGETQAEVLEADEAGREERGILKLRGGDGLGGCAVVVGAAVALGRVQQRRGGRGERVGVVGVVAGRVGTGAGREEGELEFVAEVVLDGVEDGEQHSNRLLRVHSLCFRDGRLPVAMLCTGEERPAQIPHRCHAGRQAVSARPEAIVACLVTEHKHQAHNDGQAGHKRAGKPQVANVLV